MKLPDALRLELDLHLEHSGHNLDITGTGPEYTLRFPSLASALHYSLAFWPLRQQIPPGTVVHLKYRSLNYHYRA